MKEGDKVKIKVTVFCTYNGHAIGNNGNVNLMLKSRYSELTSYIQLIQMLNNDVKISAKQGGKNPFGLGVWRIKDIKVDHDGEGQLKFNSMTDFVEVNNLNNLVLCEKGEEIQITFNSDIEIENDDTQINLEEEW